MDAAKMTSLLRGSTNWYAQGFVKGRNTDILPIHDKQVKAFLSKNLKHHKVYLCVNLDQGMDEGDNFFVAVHVATGTPSVLTDSLSNLNKVILGEGIRPQSGAEALSIATVCFELTRPLNRSFDVLTDEAECKTMTATIASRGTAVTVAKPKVTSKGREAFEGQVWVLAGRDLYRRDFEIDERGIRWSDQMFAAKVRPPTNPHE